MRTKFKWFSVLVIALIFIIFVGNIFWNAFMFADCMASGKRAYQCNAAIHNGRYIGFEDYNG